MESQAMQVRQQWLGTIQAAKSSGLSNKMWCEQNGVSVSSFYRWMHLLREDALCQISPPVQFAPVNMSSRAKDLASPQIVIETSGSTVTVPLDVSEQQLAMILRVIRSAG